MRKYITLFFSVTFFLFACKGGKAPASVIKHDQMVSLLTDLHIVDGSLYSAPQAPDSLYKYGIDKYMIAFKDHHTDSVQFKASLKYYTTQPVELQAIYDQVLVNLKKKTDSLSKPQQQYAIPKK
jgi:hypothetical protein